MKRVDLDKLETELEKWRGEVPLPCDIVESMVAELRLLREHAADVAYLDRAGSRLGTRLDIPAELPGIDEDHIHFVLMPIGSVSRKAAVAWLESEGALCSHGDNPRSCALDHDNQVTPKPRCHACMVATWAIQHFPWTCPKCGYSHLRKPAATETELGIRRAVADQPTRRR